jgi:ferredoxin--NADP+ reductase
MVASSTFFAATSRLNFSTPDSSVLTQEDTSGFRDPTVDQPPPRRDHWLLATATGLGPMLSILKGPAVWQNFAHLIVAHSVRTSLELSYRDEINDLRHNPLLATGGAQLTYLPIVTREPGVSELNTRLGELISNGQLEKAAGCTLNLADSRLMICGNPELLRDLRQLLSARGFNTNRRGVLGQMAFEKYW